MKTPSLAKANQPAPQLNRRSFVHAVLVGGSGALASPSLLRGQSSQATKPANEANQFHEPARSLPMRTDADVIVCGAGPAGFAAALTAARAGARTRLFEVHGCLGGVWTAGVKCQLHTRVAAAYRDGKRLATVVTESKSGREAWRAPVFIDATGDGDLGAQAGCGWDVGQGKDCPCQPMTLNALAVVRDAKAIARFTSFNGTDAFTGPGGHLESVEAFKQELKRANVEASYGHPTIFPVRDNLVMLMLNHEYGVKPYDAAQVTEATLRARAEVFRIVRALRSLGGVWEGLQIAATAEQIGVRDGRRIQGRYTVTHEDLIAGARHPDAVARATFGVDIHAPTREQNKTETISHGGFKTKPYDIPLRALIARDVDGLMMAGRCISGDFIAHASYRVTGNAVAMGEAAGAVAALAAKSKRLPHEVQWGEAEEILKGIKQRG